MDTSLEKPTNLKRSINFPMLCFYGLGTILGAGIYVLIGKVSATAGIYSPIAFLLAALVAVFTGLSYAELSARYPKSGGEAVYIQESFQLSWLSGLIGWAVVATGLVSAATISRGFSGYLGVFIQIPAPIATTILVFFMVTIAAWGISESVGLTAVITCIELFGLLLVLFGAGHHLNDLPQRLPELIPPADDHIWLGIIAGAFLAFYAFIGFEDMVNIAEEIKQPEDNLPRAIILVLITATLLYTLVALVAVLALPSKALAASTAPLADILHHSSNISPKVIAAISLVAVINGALVQIIMASRVVYGMAIQHTAPTLFAKIHDKTHTPINATVLIGAFVLILALLFPLAVLAKITSFIILIVFSFVNAALIKIKKRKTGPVSYPIWIPIIGLSLCLLLLSLASFGGLFWGH